MAWNIVLLFGGGMAIAEGCQVCENIFDLLLYKKSDRVYISESDHSAAVKIPPLFRKVKHQVYFAKHRVRFHSPPPSTKRQMYLA